MPDRVHMEPYNHIPLPNYEVVPLRSEHIVVSAIQMRVDTIDCKNPKPEINKRINHISLLIDLAQERIPVDLICLPEFSLQGSSIRHWSREDFLRLAIELPGEETERLGEKAKEYNCYIEVAAYTKNKDWPNHFFNCSFIIGPNGNVIHHHWKAHMDPGGLEYATTVHDVLDQFVERYGWDAVWPVARTDIGNIATFICSEGFQQETARCFAFKGAEILIRSIAGGTTSGMPRVGNPRITMQAYCMANDVYGIYNNNAADSSTTIHRVEFHGSGHTAIFDNVGRIMQEADSNQECVVTDTIPIGSYRKRHSIPAIRKEIYVRAYADYVGKYPPNLYSEYLPKDHIDGVNYARRKARW
ncbi:MAG: nitrilase-related carbon-nitrogen hydrolase [Chloroflexota bacterium]